MKRSRLLYAALLVGILVAGLATRRFGRVMPDAVAVYGGDTLWALMVFVTLGLILRSWSTLRIAGVALAISYSVELSQLFHAPSLDQLRQTTVAGLVLGRGFLWSDLLCYTIGVALGAVCEFVWWQWLRSS